MTYEKALITQSRSEEVHTLLKGRNPAPSEEGTGFRF
jgi:hypothetical protein